MMTRRILLATLVAPADSVQWISSDARHWRQQDAPVDPGSLVKPFVSLAYFATHASAPVLQCTRCWKPGGHGRQDFTSALANSCNTYFLQLASEVDRAALERTCLQFGLVAPDRNLPPQQLIGLGGVWRQTPNDLFNAYTKLTARREISGAEDVLAGMLRCSKSGTAKALGGGMYAKTGTGTCCHVPSGAGDGYVAVLYPAEQPRRTLLMQQHNTTGAHAALSARHLL